MTWANGMWGMGWMWFFPVVFLAVIGIFIAVFMRGMGGFSCGNSRAPRQEETPKETLDRRYAKGEITREQYLEMRKDLG